VHRRPILHAIAIFLLTWIAVDLVAIDTCVLDVDAEVAGDPGSGVAFRAPGSSRVPVAAHPDNCLCHGHTVVPGTPAGLAAPALVDSDIAEADATRPHGSAATLYHPPQLSSRRRVSCQM
jgi:hypothetical protein